MSLNKRVRKQRNARLAANEQAIVAMCLAGQSDQEIAAILDVGVRGVANTRARARIAPRWGTRTGRPFTPEDDALILAMRDDVGREFLAIRAALGNKWPCATICSRYEMLKRLQGAEPETVYTELVCLGPCRRRFKSPDRVRIRMCDECKADLACDSPYHPDQGAAAPRSSLGHLTSLPW